MTKQGGLHFLLFFMEVFIMKRKNLTLLMSSVASAIYGVDIHVTHQSQSVSQIAVKSEILRALQQTNKTEAFPTSRDSASFSLKEVKSYDN